MVRAFLTADDRAELFAALCERFRLGEIGPISFRAECNVIGISADDINSALDKYLDECAKNRRA